MGNSPFSFVYPSCVSLAACPLGTKPRSFLRNQFRYCEAVMDFGEINILLCQIRSLERFPASEDSGVQATSCHLFDGARPFLQPYQSRGLQSDPKFLLCTFFRKSSLQSIVAAAPSENGHASNNFRGLATTGDFITSSIVIFL